MPDIARAAPRVLRVSVNSSTGSLGRPPQLSRFGPKVVDFLGYDPLPDPKSFGQEVWKLRWSLGLTQRALAGHLGIDDVTVRGWETGRHGASEKVQRRLMLLMRTGKAPG
jgi:DNA-binding XRE family transcriptional regulator